MQRNIPSLADSVFDLLVIGGGIFGAGVARDAALRGLRVALVDQGDFASGTSCKSSKLIHGGFRYLEQFDFALVAESCRERRILRDMAPHRVTPLPLLLPVYEGGARPLWLLRLGMTLYDLLAMYRNVGPHQTLTPRVAMELEPTLAAEGLRGAIRFYDCHEDDARFVVDNVLHASSLGAVCINYCRVEGFASQAGRLTMAKVKDVLSGQEIEVRARAFINAAGPWVEKVAELAPPSAGPTPRLSPTKGVHVLLPRLTQSHGIFFQGRRDGRMMFVLPWHDSTMVGTTDTDYAGDPAAVEALPADIDYLLDETRQLFPSVSLTSADVITSFAGIRPLLASDAAYPSARSREHAIVQNGENLLSIAGGKYTTYRLIAKQTVDKAYQILGIAPAPCTTDRTPIPNPDLAPSGERLSDPPAVDIERIKHCIAHEMPQTVEDVMRRRVGLALTRLGGRETAEKVAELLTAAGVLNAEGAKASVDAYLAKR